MLSCFQLSADWMLTKLIFIMQKYKIIFCWCSTPFQCWWQHGQCKAALETAKLLHAVMLTVEQQKCHYCCVTLVFLLLLAIGPKVLLFYTPLSDLHSLHCTLDCGWNVDNKYLLATNSTPLCWCVNVCMYSNLSQWAVAGLDGTLWQSIIMLAHCWMRVKLRL